MLLEVSNIRYGFYIGDLILDHQKHQVLSNFTRSAAMYTYKVVNFSNITIIIIYHIHEKIIKWSKGNTSMCPVYNVVNGLYNTITGGPTKCPKPNHMQIHCTAFIEIVSNRNHFERHDPSMLLII